MTEKDRQAEIHEKGFDMGNYSRSTVDQYGKIKVGTKTLEDASINLGDYKKFGERDYNIAQLVDKGEIYRAILYKRHRELKLISRYFYRTNGLYQKVCDYYATMYRWDWYIVPRIYNDNTNEDKLGKEFYEMLDYLDDTHVAKVCADIAHKVIIDGCYYGYIIEGTEGIVVQELPAEYCRIRFNVRNMPVVEMNMRFFDDRFHSVDYRLKVLKMFPKDIQKGYVLWKQRKLPTEYPVTETDWFGTEGWYPLDPGCAVKFSMPGTDDIPIFINAIPSILDLDDAQALDRMKQMQELSKILIQKLPLDKNGDLIFDIDEARDWHNNAVNMLSHTVGTDIITTVADIDSIDLSDTNQMNKDSLERVERTVYNNFGVAKNLFNTDGNLSLEKSILQDEGQMRQLKLQFEIFFDRIIQGRTKNKKKYKFRFYMLDTTQYNYKEISKYYKEQMQNGQSKVLAQIALGHSQSSVIDTAVFENDYLHLSEVMIPPMMSSTMSSEDLQLLGKNKQGNTSQTQSNTGGQSSSDQVGRPAKEEGQLSDKTIQNKESQK